MSVLTKKDLINDPSVKHQQAIVNTLSRRAAEPVVFTVPGGQTLFSQEGRKNLKPGTIHTWLRRVRAFDSVTIRLTNDIGKYKTSERMVQALTKTGTMNAWEAHPLKREYLADLLYNIISNNRVLEISVRSNGIYITPDTDRALNPGLEDWEPHLIFTPKTRNG